MFRHTLIGLFCVLLVLSAGGAGAVDRNWIDTGAGLNNWNDAANWNPSDDFAKAGDNAIFDQDATYLVIVQSPSAADDISFADGNVTLGGGTLNTGGFALIDDSFAIGLGDGAIVTLSGATWDSAGDATIGDVGFGTLNINSGGDFEADEVFIGNQVGSEGEVTLTGTGTTLTATRNSNTGIFTIGNNGGTGTLHVLDDADLRTTSTGLNDIWVGSGVDPGNASNVSTGTLNVDGAGSFAETEDLNVGIFGGAGFLNITGGGQVINTDGGTNGSPDTAFGANDGAGGEKSSGTGVIDGDGSLLRSRSIFVGNLGTGRLTVSDGGEARTLTQGTALGNMFIGNLAGSDGKVAVFGNDTAGTTASLLDVDQSLFVGENGLGQLNVGRDLNDSEIGSGALQVDVDLRIGNVVGNTADNKVVVSGASATANIGGVVQVGPAGMGTLEILNGASVTSGGTLAIGGFSGGGQGFATIDGANSSYIGSGLFMGNGSGTGGQGTLTVRDGGLARFTTAVNGAVTIGDDDEGVGIVTVTGAGSRLESVGGTAEMWIGGSSNEDGGTGTLNLLAGGQATSSGRVVLGYRAGADGTLNIDGLGSQFDMNGDFLLVGFSGLGNADVTGGGQLNVNNMFVADATGSAGSQLDITGIGSAVDVAGLLNVGDTVRGTVNVSGGGQLDVATGTPTSRLIIGDEAASDGSRLTIDGAGSRVDYHGTATVAVGNAGGSTTNRATLEVTNGSVFSAVQRNPDTTIASQARIIIGDVTNGNGQVTVDGAGSLVEASVIYVGDGPSGSSGVLDITSGGVATTTGEFQAGSFGSGVGTVNIDGANSQLSVGTTLSLGDDTLGGATNGAVGTLNVIAGGTVSNGGQAYIGHFTSSFGTATLGSATSDTSSWTIGGELTIAGTETSSQTSGFGVLNVNTGGLVDVASNLRIRNLGDVNLNGGEIAVGDDILFTDAGSTFNFITGTLRFTGNKTFDAAALNGIFAGAPVPTLGANQHLAVVGAATVDAPLRLNDTTASLSIGTITDLSNLDWDAGTLNITAQTAAVGPTGLLGTSLVVDQDQSLGVPNNPLNVQATGDLNVIRGGLNVASATSNGLIVISNTTAVDFDADNNGSGLTNNNDLVAIDSTIAGAVVNNGAIEIVGTVNFTDGVTLTAGGSLGIDISGLLDFDSISVGGNASLDGLLNVDVNGFSLTGGDSFEIIDIVGTQSGMFTGLADGALVGNFGGVDLFIDYDAGDGNDVALFTQSASTVDLDADNDIDGRDFLLIQRSDPSLIPQWETEFGTGVGPLASSQVVPEPATGIMLAAVLMTCLWARGPWSTVCRIA